MSVIFHSQMLGHLSQLTTELIQLIDLYLVHAEMKPVDQDIAIMFSLSARNILSEIYQPTKMTLKSDLGVNSQTTRLFWKRNKWHFKSSWVLCESFLMLFRSTCFFFVEFVLKLRLTASLATTVTRKSILHSRFVCRMKPAMTMTTNMVSSEECWGEVGVVVSSLDSQYLPYLHF